MFLSALLATVVVYGIWLVSVVYGLYLLGWWIYRLGDDHEGRF